MSDFPTKPFHWECTFSIDDASRQKFEDVIAVAVEEIRRLDGERIENACERALLTGEMGVLVLLRADGRVVYAEPHEMVPYGRIYEGRWPRDLTV